MQHYIETEGDTVEEAIENALSELEATREQVTIDIVSEPTKGILNFGGKTGENPGDAQTGCFRCARDGPKGNSQSDGD